MAWLHILAAEGSWRYKYPKPEDRAVAYTRTLCIGHVNGEKFGPEHSAIVLSAYNTEELDDHKSDLFEEISHRGSEHRKKGMKFIITRKGHIGLAAHNVHIGDRIAILATGSVPFVLRKVSKENDHDVHILLGACYVNGEILALQHKDQGY
jgi:hypothetical protein